MQTCDTNKFHHLDLSKVYLWEKATDSLTKIFQGNNTAIFALAWTRDNRYLAFNGDHNQINIYNCQTKNIDFTFTGHQLRVIDLAFTSD